MIQTFELVQAATVVLLLLHLFQTETTSFISCVLWLEKHCDVMWLLLGPFKIITFASHDTQTAKVIEIEDGNMDPVRVILSHF